VTQPRRRRMDEGASETLEIEHLIVEAAQAPPAAP
jgi:hypothetical protein